MSLFSKKDQSRKPATPQRRSPINAYYRSEQPPAAKSPFTKKPPKTNTRKYVLGILDAVVVILALTGLGYTILIKPDPKVAVSTQAYHNQAVYQAAAANQLTHFNNRNKITFNEPSLSNALIKQFPEITNVQIELPLFSERPTIRLAIGPPSVILSSRGSNYVINSHGKAIAKASELPQINGLPLINDDSGYAINAGAQVLSTGDIKFISSLIAQCDRSNVPVTSLTLPTVPQELDLRTKDAAYFVKFHMGGSVLTEAGQFLAARNHFKQSGQTPSQYLDVRVSGKIFFK